MAVERYVAANRRYLVSLAAFYLGNIDDASEAVQDACVAVIREADRYDGTGSIRAWFIGFLRGICMNRSRDRRTADLLQEEIQQPNTDNIRNAAVEHGLEASWEAAETHGVSLIFVAMANISTLDRALLTRAYVLGEDDADIAADWEISPEALRRRLMQARRKLRQAYLAIMAKEQES